MPKTILSETKFYPVVFHREGDTLGYCSPEFGGGGAASSDDASALAQEMMDIAVAH